MKRALLIAAVCALLVPSAHAATTVTAPVYDAQGHLVQTPLAPPPGSAHLTKQQALQIVERYPKVRHWLARYSTTGRID